MLKNWLLPVAASYCLGIAGAFYERREIFYVSVFAALLWSGGCVLAMYYSRNRCSSRNRGLFTDLKKNICVLLSVSMVIFGYLAGSSGDPGSAQWKGMTGKDIVLQGFAEPDSIRKRERGIGAVLAADRPLRGKVRIFIRTDGKNTDLIAQMLPLKRIQIAGRLQEPVYLWNPGAYDGHKSDKIRGIYGRVTLSSDRLLLLDDLPPIHLRLRAFSQKIRGKSLLAMHSKEAAVLPGMVLGGYQDVEPDEADVFRDNGIAHLLAVSGTHVAVLTSFLSVLLWPLGEYRIYVIQLFLLLYVFLCGLQPSVLRAGLMAGIVLWGQGKKRKADSFRLLVLTAVGLLLMNPFWLMDTGYQLSFVTTAGLLLASHKITALIPDALPDPLRSLAGITLTAQVFTLPFSVFYFHRISLIGVFSNLFLLPDLEAAVLLFLAGLLAMPVAQFFSGFFFVAAEYFLKGATAAGSLLAELPFAAVDMADWGWMGMFCYYGFIAVFFDMGPVRYVSSRQRRCCLAAIAGAALLLCGMRHTASRQLTVHFMDVGQGDAALIRTPSGKNILVDTGGFAGEGDVARAVLLPYLRYLGVKQVDLLCLSHGDHDHAGGAAGLASKIPVRNIVLGTSSVQSKDIKRLLDTAGENTSVQYLHTGEQWQIGDCTMVTASASAGKSSAPGVTETNSSSLILQFFCRGHSLVFTGDADADTEEGAIPYLQSADVLKVGHHGSETSTSPHFLRHIRPRYGVISVGAGNRYGHPARGTLQRLQAEGITVLRTDRLGAVKFVFEKNGPRWYSFRFQGNQF